MSERDNEPLTFEQAHQVVKDAKKERPYNHDGVVSKALAEMQNAAFRSGTLDPKQFDAIAKEAKSAATLASRHDKDSVPFFRTMSQAAEAIAKPAPSTSPVQTSPMTGAKGK